MIGLYGTLSWQVNETYPDPFPGFSLTHTLMIKTLYLNYLNLLFYASQDPIDEAPGEKAPRRRAWFRKPRVQSIINHPIGGETPIQDILVVGEENFVGDARHEMIADFVSVLKTCWGGFYSLHSNAVSDTQVICK